MLTPLLYRNTQIEDTCIVFRSWHIYTTHAFVFSCLAVVALGVLYEWLRAAQAVADVKIAATLSAQNKGKARGGTVSGRGSPEIESEEAGLLTGVRVPKESKGYVPALWRARWRADCLVCRLKIPVSMRLSRAVLYGAQVFLSFFLMLIFMTYNVRHASIVLSVVLF